MNNRPVHGDTSRSAAIGDLFAALEELMIFYQVLPDSDREARWSADAELITGAVALHLSTARGRIAARPRPASKPHPKPHPGPPPTLPTIPQQVDPADDRRPA